MNNRRLELAGSFFGPTFNDYLLLHEELNRIHSLALHIAKERVLPAAKGEESHRCRHANIDINCFFQAMHHIDHTLREANLLDQLDDEQHGHGDAFRWFYDS